MTNLKKLLFMSLSLNGDNLNHREVKHTYESEVCESMSNKDIAMFSLLGVIATGTAITTYKAYKVNQALDPVIKGVDILQSYIPDTDQVLDAAGNIMKKVASKGTEVVAEVIANKKEEPKK